MFKWLITHQWKESFRSTLWRRNLVTNLFLGFILFIMILNFLGLGFFIDKIISEVAPDSDPVELFSSFLLYYFAIDLIMRYFLGKVPGLAVQPYLHLPINKSGIIHFLLSKSLLSLFNYLPLFIVTPFTFKVISANYNPSLAWFWLITFFIIILCNNFLHLYIKKQLFNKPISVGIFGIIFIIVAVIDHFNFLTLSKLSSVIFMSFLKFPVYSLIPFGILILLYFMNYNFLKSHIYLEELGTKKSKEVGRSTKYAFLNRYGELGELLTLELKLIFRNKRTRSTLYLVSPILLMGFLFYGSERYKTMEEMLIYMGALFIGLFMANYGQFIFSWEGSYFDTVLSEKFNLYLYLKVKFIIMVVSCIFHYLLLLPYVFFSTNILFLNTSLLFFNIGVSSFILLFIGTFNRKKIKIDVNATSMDSKGGSQFLVVFLLVLIPIFVYLPFKFSGEPNLGIIAIGLIGLAGLIFHKYLLEGIVKQFKKQKYQMAAGLRQS